MAIKFPGELDDLQLITTTPATTPLSEAGDGARAHDIHHRDLGSAIVALQNISIPHDHDHSGDTSATNKPGMHKGSKLLQANTHQSPDTDKSKTALHHTLGNGENQAAPGKQTKDSIDSIAAKVATLETLSKYMSVRIFATSSELSSWQLTATITEPVLAFVIQDDSFHIVSSKTNKREVDSGVPAGVVSSFAGNTAPKGYLLCNGATYSSTQYPKLYAAIGTTYGGTASAFKVPDLRGKTLFGENQSDSSFSKVGTTGGTKRHRHTEGDLAAAIGAVQNNTLSLGYLAGKVNSRGPATCYSYSLWLHGSNSARKSAYKFNHYTPVYGNTAYSDNLPPFVVMNYIIKF